MSKLTNTRDEIMTRILDLGVVGKVLSDMTDIEGDMFCDELRALVNDVLLNAEAEPAPSSPVPVEPAAVTLLRGPQRATSAEFNGWQAREAVAYIDALRGALPAAPAHTEVGE